MSGLIRVQTVNWQRLSADDTSRHRVNPSHFWDKQVFVTYTEYFGKQCEDPDQMPHANQDLHCLLR